MSFFLPERNLSGLYIPIDYLLELSISGHLTNPMINLMTIFIFMTDLMTDLMTILMTVHMTIHMTEEYTRSF